MPLPLAGIAVRILGRTAISSARNAVSSGLREMMTNARKNLVAPKLQIKVDTRAFDAALKEYMKFNKKAMSEIVNTKAYYIARNAVNMTAAVDRSKIEQELRAPAEVYPETSLASIIAAKQQNRQRFSKKTGKRLKDKAGLVGSRMDTAINKLIRIRQNTANFLRAGWIPAIKAMESYVPKKSGPSYKKVITKGQTKGGAKGSPKEGQWKTVASIWNSVSGGILKHNLDKKSSPSDVAKILEDGLQKAINKEEASMKAYVEKKLNEGINKFNSK